MYRRKAKLGMKLPLQPTLQNQVELRLISAVSSELSVVRRNKTEAGNQKLYHEKQDQSSYLEMYQETYIVSKNKYCTCTVNLSLDTLVDK